MQPQPRLHHAARRMTGLCQRPQKAGDLMHVKNESLPT